MERLCVDTGFAIVGMLYFRCSDLISSLIVCAPPDFERHPVWLSITMNILCISIGLTSQTYPLHVT